MFSGDEDKVRAFPFRPAAEPSTLTDYVELSGCNSLLIEAVKKLYQVPNKPENPIEWFRLYFKYLAEDAAANASIAGLSEGTCDIDSNDITQDPDILEQLLKDELVKIEEEIISCFEVEAQNKAIIEKLESEVKNVTLSSTRSPCYDNFLKYKDHGEDYHYRVQPSPLYQASKSDMLFDDEDDGRGSVGAIHRKIGDRGRTFAGGSSLKQNDSLVELVPFNPHMWTGDATQQQQSTKVAFLSLEDEKKVYEDYPQLYFPERQKKTPESEEDKMEDELEDGEDELELDEEDAAEDTFTDSETGTSAGRKDQLEGSNNRGKEKSDVLAEGSEYDGGSEGGESDQSKSKVMRAKEKSAYTPRSAHDNKKPKDKQSRSQRKVTNDKNV